MEILGSIILIYCNNSMMILIVLFSFRYTTDTMEFSSMGLTEGIFALDPIMVRRCHSLDTPDSAVSVLEVAVMNASHRLSYLAL